jgi:small-conductance mechanosensitive channel
MVERVERVTEERRGPTGDSTTGRRTREVSEASASGTTVMQRIIWYIAGVIIVLLAFRFILTLLGANRSNGFADFIYTTSHPFVAPFFGLFGYNLQYGVSRFELYTLVAIVVYAIIAWGLARLFALRDPEV